MLSFIDVGACCGGAHFVLVRGGGDGRLSIIDCGDCSGEPLWNIKAGGGGTPGGASSSLAGGENADAACMPSATILGGCCGGAFSLTKEENRLPPLTMDV